MKIPLFFQFVTVGQKCKKIIFFFAKMKMLGIQQHKALVKKTTFTNDYIFFPPYPNALIFFLLLFHL